MKKSNSKTKAQSAFKKLGVVALMVATLAVFFTACNQTGGGGGGKPTPKPKHAITFSVDSTTPNGTLKVEGDGITQPATSPINVEEGKTVTFTATAESGYRVNTWSVSPSSAIQSGGSKGETTATLKITADTTVSVSFEANSNPPNPPTPPNVPSVEGGAVLILSPDKLTIEVKAKTADGSAITVEGCNVATLESDKKTKLNAKGTKVILKGNITELDCSYNSLNALNVQGCASLQELYCYENKLNAQAMTKLLKALPAREAGDYARIYLYTEKTGVTEGNCKDFSQPDELKKAFEDAKSKNWKLEKINASGNFENL